MPTREEKDEFSVTVLALAEKHRTDVLDAITTYCSEIGLEMEVAAGLCNEVLKARLHDEFVELNYLEKSGRLPI
jgi:hypothetical protein